MNDLSFDIMISCPSSEKLLIASTRISEYFIPFFHANVFKQKKIIIGSEWKIVLSIFLLEEGKRYTAREVFLAKGCKTISSEKVKIYEILIPLILIKEADDYLVKTIELIYKGIEKFITNNYKTVSMEFLNEKWNEVDIDYLRSALVTLSDLKL